jgi:two-component system cell cycle sensor histidine kinase/response regulator CckA
MELLQSQTEARFTPVAPIARREGARESTAWRQDKAEVASVPSTANLRTFAGGIAHNFNNLLSAILGNAYLVREQLPPGSPLLKMLDQIDSAAHGAENLTRQMMLYAQTSAPRMESLNLSMLIGDLDGRFKGCISSNIKVEYDLSSDRVDFMGDWTQLRRLLTSLFFNAAEAIGDEPGVITLSTQVLDSNREFLTKNCPNLDLAEGQYIWLKVSDTGCGMDEETKQHIFEPFYTTKFVGRGLGLSAGLGIVDQHRGAIWVTARPGRGTIVNVLLPCHCAK